MARYCAQMRPCFQWPPHPACPPEDGCASMTGCFCNPLPGSLVYLLLGPAASIAASLAVTDASAVKRPACFGAASTATPHKSRQPALRPASACWTHGLTAVRLATTVLCLSLGVCCANCSLCCHGSGSGQERALEEHSANLTAACDVIIFHSNCPSGLCCADGSLGGHGPRAGQGGGPGQRCTHLLRGPPGPAAPSGAGPRGAGDARGHPSHPGSQQRLSLCEWLGLPSLVLLGGSIHVVLGPSVQDMPAATRLLQVSRRCQLTCHVGCCADAL